MLSLVSIITKRTSPKGGGASMSLFVSRLVPSYLRKVSTEVVAVSARASSSRRLNTGSSLSSAAKPLSKGSHSVFAKTATPSLWRGLRAIDARAKFLGLGLLPFGPSRTLRVVAGECSADLLVALQQIGKHF